jgi:hypothetical protein
MVRLVVSKRLPLTPIGLACEAPPQASTRRLRGLLHGTSTTDPHSFVLVQWHRYRGVRAVASRRAHP